MSESAQFSVGSLAFERQSGEVRSGSAVRRLEPKAAAVLAILCQHEGDLVTRQMLLDRCWGEGEGSDEALTQAIAQIRRAFDELGEGGLIETLAKRGYRLVQPAGTRPPSYSAPRAILKNKGFAFPVGLIVALIIILVIGLNPHGPRHFIRHMIGTGAVQDADSGH